MNRATCMAASAIETAFDTYDSRFTIHTRRELVHEDVVEEHLYWSSPLGTATLDIYVSHEKLRATWSGATEWLHLAHHEIIVLKSAIERTPGWTKPSAPSPHCTPTRMTDIGTFSLGEILSLLPFEDIIRMLQTGDRRLLQDLRSTHVNRVEVTTEAAALCLFRSTTLRRVLPFVHTVHVHVHGGFSAYDEGYDLSNLSRTVVSLRTPFELKIRAPTSAITHEPFVHLQELSVPKLRSPCPIELLMPNLTSLNITEAEGLPHGAATALPSMLRSFTVSISDWEGLIKLTGDMEWSSLHTLTMWSLTSDARASMHLLPNVTRCPSLTNLAFRTVTFQPDCNLDMVSDLRCLKHLAFECVYSASEANSILQRTVRAFPPCLESATIRLPGDESDFPAIGSHLARLMPSIQKITLHGACLADVSLIELMDLPNLSRICLDRDELCKIDMDGAVQWHTFSSLLLKADVVPPRVFECFELVSGDRRIPWYNAPALKAASVLLKTYPSTGMRMALRCDDRCLGVSLHYFSTRALHTWLKYSTSADFDLGIVSAWCYLLSAIRTPRMYNAPHLLDALQHHKLHTHPILFRYLLHITFLFVVQPKGLYDYDDDDDRWSSEILSHLSSQYGYTGTLNCETSTLTLMCMVRAALAMDDYDCEYEYDVAIWHQLIEMMERPYWADACCKGEIADSSWFDQRPMWRACRIARDAIVEAFPDSEYAIAVDVNNEQGAPCVRLLQHGECKMYVVGDRVGFAKKFALEFFITALSTKSPLCRHECNHPSLVEMKLGIEREVHYAKQFMAGHIQFKCLP